MAVTEFYNWNEHRKYPMVEPPDAEIQIGIPPIGVTLPDEAFLDCGFVLGSRLSHVSGINYVYLYGINKTGDDLQFIFTTNAVSYSAANSFTFVRDKNAEWGSTDFISIGSGPEDGTAFLVTGNLYDLWDALPSGLSLMYLNPVPMVEPSTVVSLKGHTVKSVNVGNLPKPSGARCCAPAPTPGDQVQMVAEGLKGEIRFKPGYNMSAYINMIDNAVIFAPVIGEGMGEICNEFSEPNIPKCADLVYSVNNVAPSDAGVFGLTGSNGIVVTGYPLQHKIVISGDVHNTVYCG